MTEPRSSVGIPERVEVTQGEGPSEAYAQRAAIVEARLEVARERGSSERFIAFLEASLEWLVEGERIALAREQAAAA
jgi:hypothetical protein